MEAAKWEQKAFTKWEREYFRPSYHDEMVALKHRQKEGGENEGDIILESNQGH